MSDTTTEPLDQTPMPEVAVKAANLQAAASVLLEAVEAAAQYIAGLPHSRAGSDLYLRLLNARNLALDGAAPQSRAARRVTPGGYGRNRMLFP